MIHCINKIKLLARLIEVIFNKFREAKISFPRNQLSTCYKCNITILNDLARYEVWGFTKWNRRLFEWLLHDTMAISANRIDVGRTYRLQRFSKGKILSPPLTIPGSAARVGHIPGPQIPHCLLFCISLISHPIIYFSEHGRPRPNHCDFSLNLL